MRSQADRTEVSIVASLVGAGVGVVVVADLVTGAAAVAWPGQRTSCILSFCGAYIIGGHMCDELCCLEAVAGGALA